MSLSQKPEERKGLAGKVRPGTNPAVQRELAQESPRRLLHLDLQRPGTESKRLQHIPGAGPQDPSED
jgi:hypothetical protein